MGVALKLAGALLIFGGCTGLGLQKSGMFGERVRAMEETAAVIWKIQGEVRVSGVPLGHIFLKISAGVPEPYANLLRRLSRRMEAQEGERLADLWAAELSALPEDLYRPEDRECLLQLGRSLGCLDLTMQVELLEGFLADWGRRIEECRLEKKEKQKVYRCLGMAAGAFLVLALL